MLGTTFGGNHLACAAALAVLRTIAEDGLLEHVTQVGKEIATAVEGLAVLTAGGSPETAATSSDLMHGARLRQVLNSVSERFDIVILDTPPVLALSDAAVVGALIDRHAAVTRHARELTEIALASGSA